MGGKITLPAENQSESLLTGNIDNNEERYGPVVVYQFYIFEFNEFSKKVINFINFVLFYLHTNTHACLKIKCGKKSSHSHDYLEFYQRKHHVKYGAIDNYMDAMITVEQVSEQVKSVENDDEELKLVILPYVCPKITF